MISEDGYHDSEASQALELFRSQGLSLPVCWTQLMEVSAI